MAKTTITTTEIQEAIKRVSTTAQAETVKTETAPAGGTSLSQEAYEALGKAKEILESNPDAIQVTGVSDVPDLPMNPPEDKKPGGKKATGRSGKAGKGKKPTTAEIINRAEAKIAEEKKQAKDGITYMVPDKEAEKRAREAEKKRKAEEKKKAEIAKAEQAKLETKRQAGLEREFKKRSGIIERNLASIESSFLAIAFQLHWIKRNGMHKTAGFKNIYDYAESTYSIGRTSCSNLICIVEDFADRDENGEVTEQIADCYRKFKQSQLVAMLGMSPALIEKIDPRMSVRDILKLKKDNEIVQDEDDGDEDDGDGGTGNNKEPIAKTEREVLTQFSDYNEYLSNLEGMEKKLQKALKENDGNVVIQIVCVKRVG